MGISKDRARTFCRDAGRGDLLAFLRKLDDLQMATWDLGDDDKAETVVSYIDEVKKEGAPAQMTAGNGSGEAALQRGTVLAIQERYTDNTADTCGTVSILSPEGLAITARHCVVWDDSKIHPNRLCVMGYDDVQVQHVLSFPDIDVTALRLVRQQLNTDTAPATEGAASGSQTEPAAAGSKRKPSSTGSKSSEASDTTSWPYLQIADKDVTDVSITMHGFALAAEQEQLLAHKQPVTVHGKVSHYSNPAHIGVADYQGFPNMSGGPVIHQGQYLGTHVSAVLKGQTEEGTVTTPISRTEEGDEIVNLDGPVDRPPSTIAAGKVTVANLAARVRKLKAASGCNAQLGLFAPASQIIPRLVGKVPELGADEWQLAAVRNAKQARHV